MRLLILGGTGEARRLTEQLAQTGQYELHYALAGVTQAPLLPNGITQLHQGGFGGATGLMAFCLRAGIDGLIDATHPFAAEISRSAVKAAMTLDRPLLRLARKPWQAEESDDNWHSFRQLDDMVLQLAQQSDEQRILLAIGRKDVYRFAPLSHHHFWIRSIEPPASCPPQSQLISARGPFSEADELALLQQHKISLIIAKNSGDPAGRAKLNAARAQGCAVWLLAPPKLPPCLLAYDCATAVGYIRTWTPS